MIEKIKKGSGAQKMPLSTNIRAGCSPWSAVVVVGFFCWFVRFSGYATKDRPIHSRTHSFIACVDELAVIEGY